MSCGVFTPGRRRLVLGFALVLSIATFALRLAAFADLEPRSDQAFFAWWVDTLRTADHVLPVARPGEPGLAALERDRESFLHRLLRPVYTKPTSVFTAVPLALISGLTWPAGASYRWQVALSVLASAGTVFVLGLFPLFASPGPRSRGRGWAALGPAAALVGATSFYLHAFSGLGVHNFGILFLTLAVLVTERVLGDLRERPGTLAGRRPFLLLGIAHGLALYAHWTNLFLLPAATACALLAGPRIPGRGRLSLLWRYMALVALLLVPALPVAALEFTRSEIERFHSITTLAGMALDAGPMAFLGQAAGRAAAWAEAGATLFSEPGLVLGLAGLGLMAVSERIVLPFSLVAVHFGVWLVLPIFAGAGLRTYPYVLPFLALGAAYGVVLGARALGQAFRDRVRPSLACAVTAPLAFALLALHGADQVPPLAANERLRTRAPEVWAFYFAGQGELRPMLAEIRRALPERAVLLTWGYGLQFLYRGLAEPAGRVRLPPALYGLWLRQRQGLLSGYLRRRGLSLPGDRPVYLLVDWVADDIAPAEIPSRLAAILGPKGLGRFRAPVLHQVKSWRLGGSWPKRVALYRISEG